MTETFTASNGVEVVLNREHWAVPRNGMREPFEISTTAHSALREFFLHERDKELGRWRYPENPNYVVYPEQPSMTEPEPGVRVLHEVTGRSRGIGRGATGACDATLSVFGRAARAFFAAHPEPKPWHAAQVGEVWVVKLQTGPPINEIACIVVEKGDALMFEDPVDEMHIRVTGEILAARRIWPEEA